ncbi:AraC family transcriptional regulator [Lonsdalea quercina]|uniref:AraC family transcriptional regulator n=1 Tax=Lonsdalea quercina TaxID=71657 RepID=UPI003976E542
MGQTAPQEQAHFSHLPTLGGLDMLQACYHRQRFSRHSHENFCIGVIEKGAQRFYRTGGEHVAPKGDIILVNADEIHTGYAGTAEGWSYRAIYPSVDMLRGLSNTMRDDRGDTPWFPHAVAHDPGLSEQLRMTFSLLSVEGNTLLKETLLCSSLVWLMMRHGKTREEGHPLTNADHAIRQVKMLLDDSPEENLSLLALANLAGLSPWHFLRQFKNQVGMPPHAYLVQSRLRKATTLLRQGHPLSEVSARCGFSDQSHFNRHFKKALGVTPGQFLRALKR